MSIQGGVQAQGFLASFSAGTAMNTHGGFPPASRTPASNLQQQQLGAGLTNQHTMYTAQHLHGQNYGYLQAGSLPMYAAPMKFAPPPPPPPPRAVPCHSRRASGSHDGSLAALSLSDAREHASTAHDCDKASVSSADMSLPDAPHPKACLPSCRECGFAMRSLEARLAGELLRVERDAAISHEHMSRELDKLRKERDSTWKHVGDIKENNRLLRQHGSDLETQNLQLQQSVLLMQQQVSLLNDTQAEWQSLVRITQDRNALLSATLVDQKIPKVPHTGADIW